MKWTKTTVSGREVWKTIICNVTFFVYKSGRGKWKSGVAYEGKTNLDNQVFDTKEGAMAYTEEEGRQMMQDERERCETNAGWDPTP